MKYGECFYCDFVVIIIEIVFKDMIGSRIRVIIVYGLGEIEI